MQGIDDIVKVAVGIVLYNQLLEESSSYRSLKRSVLPEGMDAVYVILDNSDIEDIRIANRRYCWSCKDITYADMGGNEGLPKAYNTLIDSFSDSAVEWMITCDQDTLFPENYYERVKPFLSDNRFVIAPAVFSAGKQISPYTGRFGGLAKRKYYINSGMIYPVDRFKEGMRFNTDLFIDFVDNDIVNRLYRQGIMAVETDIRLEQDFSGTTRQEKKAVLKRFCLYIEDAGAYIRSWPQTRLYTEFCLIKRALKLTIIYKSMSFIKQLKLNKNALD